MPFARLFTGFARAWLSIPQTGCRRHTDSVGTEAFHQHLSEQRAEGVRTYLTQQGVPESSTGFGKTRPVASNDTSEGRQQNRRVELVVSGEVIGTKILSLNLQPTAAFTSPQ